MRFLPRKCRNFLTHQVRFQRKLYRGKWKSCERLQQEASRKEGDESSRSSPRELEQTESVQEYWEHILALKLPGRGAGKRVYALIICITLYHDLLLTGTFDKEVLIY